MNYVYFHPVVLGVYNMLFGDTLFGDTYGELSHHKSIPCSPGLCDIVHIGVPRSPCVTLDYFDDRRLLWSSLFGITGYDGCASVQVELNEIQIISAFVSVGINLGETYMPLENP